jgi:hypothetical protein
MGNCDRLKEMNLKLSPRCEYSFKSLDGIWMHQGQEKGKRRGSVYYPNAPRKPGDNGASKNTRNCPKELPLSYIAIHDNKILSLTCLLHLMLLRRKNLPRVPWV